MEGNTYLVHKPAVNAPGKSTSCAAPCSTSSAAQFTRHTNHCPQRGSLSIKDGVGKSLYVLGLPASEAVLFTRRASVEIFIT
eukprot:scaffold260297_cov17-Tisochrysis_lutea.AAC.1